MFRVAVPAFLLVAAVSSQSAAQATLTVTGTCPGSITIDVSGATPFGPVILASSPTPGPFLVTGGPCAGTLLGLASPSIFKTATLGPSGSASTTLTAPAAACGLNLQLVDLAACTASNVATLPTSGPPSIVGDYSGSTTVVFVPGSCEGPPSLTFTAAIDIFSEFGGTFAGQVQNTTIFLGFSFLEIMDLQGTVSPTGAIAGTFTDSLFIDGIFDSSGAGTFQGQAGGGSIDFDFQGQDLVGGTCVYSGNTAGTMP